MSYIWDLLSWVSKDFLFPWNDFLKSFFTRSQLSKMFCHKGLRCQQAWSLPSLASPGPSAGFPSSPVKSRTEPCMLPPFGMCKSFSLLLWSYTTDTVVSANVLAERGTPHILLARQETQEVAKTITVGFWKINMHQIGNRTVMMNNRRGQVYRILSEPSGSSNCGGSEIQVFFRCPLSTFGWRAHSFRHPLSGALFVMSSLQPPFLRQFCFLIQRDTINWSEREKSQTHIMGGCLGER